MDHPFNDDLREALDSDEAYRLLPDGTWLSGGCGLLAHTLERLLPGGDLIVVGRLAVGIPDHLVYRIEEYGEPIYIDYNGLQTEQEIIQASRDECRTSDISMAPLSELEASGVDVSNLYWQTDNAAMLARAIEAIIGPVERERLSLDWLWDDDEDEAPGMAPG